MTVTLNLPPNIEQLYVAEAQARGLAVEEVIEEALLAARHPVTPSDELSPEEWMRRFKEWSESSAHANLPVLSDHAVSASNGPHRYQPRHFDSMACLFRLPDLRRDAPTLMSRRANSFR